MAVELPIPPTANHLWKRRGERFYLNPTYRDWLDACGFVVKSAFGTMPPPVQVSITVHGGKGFNRSRDIDNLIKPTIDLLRKAGVLVGDRVEEVSRVEATYWPASGKKAVAKFLVDVVPWDG